MRRMFLIFISFFLPVSFSQTAKENSMGPSPVCNVKTNYSATGDILFGDYKVFMIYTRDSIMREILSEELADFCISYASKYECSCLDWDIPINLNHDEIVEILSNYADYGDNFDFLDRENDEYYVDISYLTYRSARSDTDGINIFPDLHKLDPQILKNVDFRFGTDNKWNESLDGQSIYKTLTPRQIEAYQEWNSSVGLKKARKMTRNKVIKPGYTNTYGN
jgi:hypothetical protein